MTPAVLTIDLLDASGRQGMVDSCQAAMALSMRPYFVATGLSWPAPEGVRVSWLDVSDICEAVANLWEREETRVVHCGVLGQTALVEAIQPLARKRPIPLVVHWWAHDGWTDRDAFRDQLLPLATILVTSFQGAEELTGLPVGERVDRRRVARTLSHLGAPWILLYDEAGDEPEGLLWGPHHEEWLSGPMLGGPRVSAAVSALLAQHTSLVAAVHRACRWTMRRSE
ncbi:MAG: bifunctional hydroxymethylpyrimidine kinase/phosphomethylpyrimidine kinase [Firmicutes bacterium]|nr:bifunctional hydroxymethylpyrimidine kinase/phosphomethylpyrimidine kinase [Bacillota bacterium]